MFCPICRNTDVDLFSEIDNYPAIIWPVQEDDLKTIRHKRIRTFLCSECGHIYQDENNSDFTKYIYENLYKYYTHENVEAMNETYQKGFEEVFKALEFPVNAEVLEIGTSSANQMKIYLDNNMNCTAINPGAKAHEKITFIDGYYGEKQINKKFDLIVARLLLEHIYDLSNIVNEIKFNLKENGVVIIQVPNTLEMIKDRVLNFLAHEHFHYFNHFSLIKLFKDMKYKLIRTNSLKDPSIIAVFQYQNTLNKPKEEFNNFLNIKNEIDNYRSNCDRIVDDVRKLAHKKKIIFYGAGLSLTALLYKAQSSIQDVENCEFVDDNPLYVGKYFPMTRYIVSDPQKIELTDDTCVILICRGIYHERILKRIKKLNWNTQIYTIGTNGIERMAIE